MECLPSTAVYVRLQWKLTDQNLQRTKFSTTKFCSSCYSITSDSPTRTTYMYYRLVVNTGTKFKFSILYTFFLDEFRAWCRLSGDGANARPTAGFQGTTTRDVHQ